MLGWKFNCIDSWSFYCYLIADKGLIVLISDHDDLFFYTIFGPSKIILVHMRRVNQNRGKRGEP